MVWFLSANSFLQNRSSTIICNLVLILSANIIFFTTGVQQMSANIIFFTTGVQQMSAKWSDFFLPIPFFSTEAQESPSIWSEIFCQNSFLHKRSSANVCQMVWILSANSFLLNNHLQFGLISFYQKCFSAWKNSRKFSKMVRFISARMHF